MKTTRALTLLAAILLWSPHGVWAQVTYTDNFNTPVDYVTNGIPGTIWDGLYLGAGEIANATGVATAAGSVSVANANISSNNVLTVSSVHTDWESAADDGVFFFKVVTGDFDMSVHVFGPIETNTQYNFPGLMVRAFGAGGAPRQPTNNAVSENSLLWARFNEFSFANMRKLNVNGGKTDTGLGTYPNPNFWLRIQRIGNVFSLYEKALEGNPWTLVGSSTRGDFSGASLQAGIEHAAFSFGTTRTAYYEKFSLTVSNQAPATAPSPAANLVFSDVTNRSATLSWVSGAGSSGSVVAIWTNNSSVVKQAPANGFTYSGNAGYGLGTTLPGLGYYVVYAGSDTNVTVTNLVAGTAYNAAVFAYAGSGSSTVYTNSPAAGSFTTSGSVAPASTNSLVVDPAGPPLTNYTSLAEWNTDGDLEGWSLILITNGIVTNGVLTGTANGVDPLIGKAAFAGPDLDLGFNDYLEIRIQLPADYLGNVQIRYGVTNTPGFSDTRLLTIPPEQIPKDGAFHVYRFDVGLEVFWRGNLRDLRIDPMDATGSGKAFAIDYLRVGDLTGDTYLPRYTTANPAAGQLHELGRPVLEMLSKHFRFLWDTNAAAHPAWRPNTPHGSLRNLEEAWQVYAKYLGYREPSESWNPANRNGNKYKVNFSTWHDGYWAGNEVPGSVAHGRMNITPDGLQVDNMPTWVIPHELMHVFQFHQKDGGQALDGMWSEGHANYARELWLNYYRPILGNQSNIDANYIHSAHLIVAHGRDYYLSWPFFVYLDENPDGLPDLGNGIVSRIWRNAVNGVYLYNTLESLTPVSNVKDIVGYFARRELTFDYQNQVAMLAELNKPQWNPTIWRRFQLTELVRRADDTNWWRVPMEMAPMQGAYTTHELIPSGSGTGRVVTVNFHGLPDPTRGADWRAAFIALSDTGVERYTPLWNAGSNSITLAADENRLYVAVAGTPDSFVFTGHDDLTYPYRSHPSKQRLHYELQVFGATPKESTNSTAGLIQHANGGGYKSATAVVDATAYIGPNARVLGNGWARNFARVEDYAVVTDSAQVLNNAIVSGHALVMNSAVIKQNAKVRDWAVVSGSSVVADFGRVLEHAQVTGGLVTNSGIAKGCAILQSGTSGFIGGWGVIEGDFMGTRAVTNGFAFGHQPFVGVPDSWVRAAPDNLYVQYEFGAANNSMVRDQTGVTDGYTVGNPAWATTLAGRSGVLSFNGVNQYVVLDRSVSDSKNISVMAWVRWLGGAGDQPVFYFGSATNKCMFFTPDDGSGHARFVIRNGGADQVLIAPQALATGVWTHVAVTLSNNIAGRLYVNGVLQQQGAIAISADQLNAPNTGLGGQHNYLARGADASQPFFNGAVDSFRVYTRALTNGEISALGPVNVAPTLAPVSDRVVQAGVTVLVTNAANDSGLPWQTLTFGLLTAPAGATIQTNTGVFSWRPGVGQADTTNAVQVQVADNGLPSFSASTGFQVTVLPLARPVLSATAANGQFALQVNGDFGPDYAIQTSTNLVDWTTIFSINQPALPFYWSDPDPQLPALFYRVRLSP